MIKTLNLSSNLLHVMSFPSRSTDKCGSIILWELAYPHGRKQNHWISEFDSLRKNCSRKRTAEGSISSLCSPALKKCQIQTTLGYILKGTMPETEKPKKKQEQFDNGLAAFVVDAMLLLCVAENQNLYSYLL